MLERMCEQQGWSRDDVLQAYPHGVDWQLLRDVVWKEADLSAAERHALLLVACDGYWTDERRWRAGYTGHGSCGVCLWETGSAGHSFFDCSSLQPFLALQKAAGRLKPLPGGRERTGLAPLFEKGLPPKAVPWEPAPEALVEGFLPMDNAADTYGDGSGIRQDVKVLRIASWSAVRVRRNQAEWVIEHGIRCLVPGWFPTVPRAEASAFIEHLKHGGSAAHYGGDCSAVVQAACDGVPPQVAIRGPHPR